MYRDNIVYSYFYDITNFQRMLYIIVDRRLFNKNKLIKSLQPFQQINRVNQNSRINKGKSNNQKEKIAN